MLWILLSFQSLHYTSSVIIKHYVIQMQNVWNILVDKHITFLNKFQKYLAKKTRISYLQKKVIRRSIVTSTLLMANSAITITNILISNENESSLWHESIFSHNAWEQWCDLYIVCLLFFKKIILLYEKISSRLMPP